MSSPRFSSKAPLVRSRLREKRSGAGGKIRRIQGESSGKEQDDKGAKRREGGKELEADQGEKSGKARRPTRARRATRKRCRDSTSSSAATFPAESSTTASPKKDSRLRL